MIPPPTEQTSAVRPLLVKGRQVPQDLSPGSGALAKDPLQPVSMETSSSSYDYWWPYPPGGVAPAFSTAQPAFNDKGERITATSATSSTRSDASESTASADSPGLDLTASLVHITAVVPATETSASSTATPTFVSAYKHSRTFNILWLSPLFVLLGILIGATLAGWSYGRWARRRGRVSSISANKRPEDDDPRGARGSYAQLATGMRIVSGTRRVSARRHDSYEDIKLTSADDRTISEKMPSTPPRPHFPSDDEEEPPATGSKLRFSATRTIKGWIASVRSTGSVASMARSGYSPPRDKLQHLHLREAAATSYDGHSLYSVHRHATVYRASPDNRGVELRDDGVKAMRRLTPASTIDEDYASTITTDFPESLGSPQRIASEAGDALPTSTGSGYTPAATRPSSKHIRIGSVAASEGTDDGDALRIRQSIMDRMQLLKDEVSVDSIYMVDSSDDEWQSLSPSRASRARAKSMRRSVLESVQGSPAVNDTLDTMRLSAEMARDKRFSTDKTRRSLIPASAPATPGPSALLTRIKARFEQRKVDDESEQTLLSPTPSEALIGSAFRDAMSPRLAPTISPLRLKSKLAHGTTLDALLRNAALDASVSSLELDASPPQSQLPFGVKNFSSSPSPSVRRSEVPHPARPSAVAKHAEPATIRLTISRSSSSSVTSLQNDPSDAPAATPQASRSSVNARLSASSSPLSTPNRIPRLQGSRPVSELPGRTRAGSGELRTPSPRLPSSGFIAEPQMAVTANKGSGSGYGLRRASARRISATADGLGGRTISVTAAAAQARRERGASVTASQLLPKSTAAPVGKAPQISTYHASQLPGPHTPSSSAASNRRGTIATTTGRVPVAPSARPTRSNTAPSPKLATPSTLRRVALGRVDDIVARSWSERDGQSNQGWKSPTNFGADVPALAQAFTRS